MRKKEQTRTRKTATDAGSLPTKSPNMSAYYNNKVLTMTTETHLVI